MNHGEYLKDETGGRRFWPVECGEIDIAKLRGDRDQLWAEAVARYRGGEHWWLETTELNAAATKEQEVRYQQDPGHIIAAAIKGRIRHDSGTLQHLQG